MDLAPSELPGEVREADDERFVLADLPGCGWHEGEPGRAEAEARRLRIQCAGVATGTLRLHMTPTRGRVGQLSCENSLYAIGLSHSDTGPSVSILNNYDQKENIDAKKNVFYLGSV